MISISRVNFVAGDFSVYSRLVHDSVQDDLWSSHDCVSGDEEMIYKIISRRCDDGGRAAILNILEIRPPLDRRHDFCDSSRISLFVFFTGSLYGWRFPLPYCDQKMANVAGVTAIQESGSGKNTIRLVRLTAM